MKLSLLLASAFLVALMEPARGARSAREFVPERGVTATLAVDGPRVKYEIRKGGMVHAESVSIETEKALQVRVADYNFDGYLDFAVSHVDDGMGTYVISHIYTYVPNTQRFVPMTPACGDEFINVVLNKKRRTLRSTFYADNVMRACTTKF